MANTLIAESDFRAVYNNPTCSFTSAFVSAGNDEGCFGKVYSVETLTYFEADCKTPSGKPHHVSEQGYLHVAQFNDFTWNQQDRTWSYNNQKIAYCDSHDRPVLDRDYYYTVETDTSVAGVLKVKAKLYKK